MGIGTQVSGALVLATAPPKTRGRSEAEREARVCVWYGLWRVASGGILDSAKWCLGYFYHFKAEMGLLPF